MAKVYNVVFPHKYTVGQGNQAEERTDMIRVGTAFPMKEADGFSVELLVPLALPEGTRLLMFAREPKDEQGGATGSNGNGNNNRNNNQRGGRR